MVFSSLVFLSIFLPAVFLLHWILPWDAAKNVILLAASLLFYAYGEPVYVLVMLISVALNYVWGFLVRPPRRGAGFFLFLAVASNLGILSFFKYAGFFITTVNEVCRTSFAVPQIHLPIGISFFTFQAMSYVIDVYRGQVKPQHNPAKLLLYISFFPQLIAGPIVKYHDIETQLTHRTVSVDDIARGLRRFITGLGKKVLIANTMAAAADAVFSLQSGEVNMLSAWLGAVAYLMQIYYDFSGYSDMAIGLGLMFGFRFRENFNYPYAAESIQDFWRRWHISLSTWFKEYLYIPLGGNRKGTARTCINRIIVFFFTGLWHGANWTFIVWGLYHGFFLLLEAYVPKFKVPALLRHLYALLVVCIGFVIFRADNMAQAVSMIGKMFAGFSFDAVSMGYFWQQMTPLFVVTVLLAMIFALPVRQRLETASARSVWMHRAVSAATYTVSVAILVLSMLRLAGGTYNPFIYFRF